MPEDKETCGGTSLDALGIAAGAAWLLKNAAAEAFAGEEALWWGRGGGRQRSSGILLLLPSSSSAESLGLITPPSKHTHTVTQSPRSVLLVC